jgi:hypothetical protein
MGLLWLRRPATACLHARPRIRSQHQLGRAACRWQLTGATRPPRSQGAVRQRLLKGRSPRDASAVPIVALTATATPAVERDIAQLLHFRSDRCKTVRASFNRPNITYCVSYISVRPSLAPHPASSPILFLF